MALHWVFVVFAVPLVVFLAIRTPAFQSPDEDGHFSHSWQIAHGVFFGGGGGYVDSAIAQLNSCVAALPHHPQVHMTAIDETCVHNVLWSGQLTYQSFPNTAVNFPANYIPQALAILIGQKLGATVLNTLILARLLNGAVAIAVCALALSIYRRGKVVVFALLLMPMTLSLFASSSQDAALIAFTCFTFSLISRQLDAGSPLTKATAAVVVGGMFLISIGRPPYASLALLFFIPGLLPSRSRTRGILNGLALTAATVGVTLAWWVSVIRSTRGVSQPYVHVENVDPRMQLLNVIHHPGLAAKLLGYIGDHTSEYIAGMIGNLGWLDTVMPFVYYVAILLVLGIGVRTEMANGRRLPKSAPLYFFVAAFTSVTGIFVIEYLIGAPVGATGIYTVQGRYFIPLFIAVAVGLPRVGDAGKDYEYVTAIAVGAQLITAVVLPIALLARYYGG